MTRSLITEQLKQLPNVPGVYLMRSADGDILYVGKAASLRHRVRSYFSPGQKLSPKTRRMVARVNDIDFFSVCEHHMLPFFGKAHVAYIPNGKIVGLSKIARVVDAYARRLQVQERMTAQIATCLMENLEPLGVAVVLHARHLCMMMRGIQKQNSYAVTSEMLGCFKNDPKTRGEFLTLIREKP